MRIAARAFGSEFTSRAVRLLPGGVRLAVVALAAACSHDAPSHDAPTSDAPSPHAATAAEFELVTRPPPPPRAPPATDLFVDTDTGMVGAAGRKGRPIREDDTAQFEEIGAFLGHLCGRFGPPDPKANGYRYIVRDKPTGMLFSATANASWGFLYLAYPSLVTGGAKPEASPELRPVLARFDDFIEHSPSVHCEATFDSDEDGLARIGSEGGKGYIHPYPSAEAMAFRIAAAKSVSSLESTGEGDVEREAHARAWVAPFVEWDALVDADRSSSAAQVRAYWQRRYAETLAYKGRPGADGEVLTMMACMLHEVSHPELLATPAQRAELAKIATSCE